MSTAMTAGLSEMQAAFVGFVLNGNAPKEAARLAGYSNYVQGSTNLMNSPAVLAALHEGVQQSLREDAAVNLQVLRKIRDDEKAPARVRADIGVKLLHMAGHVVPSNKDNRPQKAISEMTREEMLDHIQQNQEAIDKAEAELMARAKDVSPGASVADSVPSEGQGEAKSLSYLD